MSPLRWSALSQRLQAFDHARWDRWLGVASGAAAALVSAILLGLLDVRAPVPAPREPLSASRVAGFEANRGDTEGVVRFLSRADGFLLGLAPAEARLRPACPLQRCATIRLRLVGASGARLVPEDPLPGSAWASVLYQDVYPGIGLRFVGYGGELSYAFLIDRGASAQSILIELEGVDRIDHDADGGLIAAGSGARLALPRPTAQQILPKDRVPVEVSYVVQGRQVRLEVGPYDIRRPLEVSGGRGFVIDPHAAEASATSR
jgi:hypothetical protein